MFRRWSTLTIWLGRIRRRAFSIVEIAEPDDHLSEAYDKAIILCVIISIVPLCFKGAYAAFTWIDELTVSFFLLDYFLRWMTADLKHPEQGADAFIQYPFTFFAIMDLLSILPSLHVLNPGFKLFRLMFLNRAFKAFKLLRYSKSFQLIYRVLQLERDSLLAVGYLACGYIFLSALVMFSAEPGSFGNFFDALYWAVITLTSVGYGDVVPVSALGRLVSMISSIMGVAVIALPTGIITARYMSELGREQGKADRGEQE